VVVSCGRIVFWPCVSQVANEAGGLCGLGMKQELGDGFSGKSGLVMDYIVTRLTQTRPGIYRSLVHIHAYAYKFTTKLN
jgi:hypothetical protein